jgi:hypothetical protein
MDYAGAVSVDRGRCYRFIYDEHGKPENFPQPPIATGWLQVGPKYQVDSCSEQSGQLRQRAGPTGLLLLSVGPMKTNLLRPGRAALKRAAETASQGVVSPACEEVQG